MGPDSVTNVAFSECLKLFNSVPEGFAFMQFNLFINDIEVGIKSLISVFNYPNLYREVTFEKP